MPLRAATTRLPPNLSFNGIATIRFNVLEQKLRRPRCFTMTTPVQQRDSDAVERGRVRKALLETFPLSQSAQEQYQEAAEVDTKYDIATSLDSNAWESWDGALKNPSLNERNLRMTWKKPYSIPEEAKWRRVPRTNMHNILAWKGLQGVPSAQWTAHRATRPLLLTLDAFDTLFTPKTPVPQQYCEVAKEFGFDLQEEEVAEQFKVAFKDMSKQYPNYGKESDMSPETWWAEVIRQTLGKLVPNGEQIPDELVTKLYRRFSSKQGYRLFKDVGQLLGMIGTSHQAAKWSPRRTMLGIISNSDPRVRAILHSFGVQIYPSLHPPRYAPSSRKFHPKYGFATFAFATLSYETGNAKPSPHIFADAEQDAQSALNRVHAVGRLSRSGYRLLGNVHQEFHHLHVGDELEKDVLPALDCGWDAVLLDRTMEKDRDIEIRHINGRDVTVIRSLLCLRELVTAERLEADGGQKPVLLPDGRHIDVGRPKKTERYGHRVLSLGQSRGKAIY